MIEVARTNKKSFSLWTEEENPQGPNPQRSKAKLSSMDQIQANGLV